MKSTTTILIILFANLVSGCVVGEKNLYGCFVGQRVVGNEMYVSVGNVYNEMDALPLADKHCANHGKKASEKEFKNCVARYDCK